MSTYDKDSFYREVNGVGDWVAYLVSNSKAAENVPDSVIERFLEDGTGLVMADIIFVTAVGGDSVQRIGYMQEGFGTLNSEDDFDTWVDTLTVGEQNKLITFDEYAALVAAESEEEEEEEEEEE